MLYFSKELMAKKRKCNITSNLSLNDSKPFGKLIFHEGCLTDFIFFFW